MAEAEDQLPDQVGNSLLGSVRVGILGHDEGFLRASKEVAFKAPVDVLSHESAEQVYNVLQTLATCALVNCSVLIVGVALLLLRFSLDSW
jgi:hypothetical protein